MLSGFSPLGLYAHNACVKDETVSVFHLRTSHWKQDTVKGAKARMRLTQAHPRLLPMLRARGYPINLYELRAAMPTVWYEGYEDFNSSWYEKVLIDPLPGWPREWSAIGWLSCTDTGVKQDVLVKAAALRKAAVTHAAARHRSNVNFFLDNW